jgi:hypothetical protein
MSCEQFKQGDWVKILDEPEPFRVERVVGYNVYVVPTIRSFAFGWVDYRSIFNNNGVNELRNTMEIKVLDRDCTLIPKEVVDIMRGV